MEIDLERLKPMFKHGDVDETVTLITESCTAAEVPKVFHRMGKDFYWKEKDIDTSVRAFEFGLRFIHGISLPAVAESAEEIELLGEAKAMNFDLGSFCWPGWDEAEINLGPAHIEKGKAAAAENLRLAIELERPSLPMANAHWLVGAYKLVERDWGAAIESFARAVELAADHGEVEVIGLMASYVALAAHLSGADSADLHFAVTMEPLPEALKQQLKTAWRVFCQ